MDLEQWVVELLKSIKESADNCENFDLHLDAVAAMQIADAYDNIEWIEIY